MLGAKGTAWYVLDIKLVTVLELKLTRKLLDRDGAGVYNVIIKIIMERKSL